FVSDFESFAIVTPAVASLASDINRRQKVHFDFDKTIALTFLAAATLDVKTESAGLVAANPRRGQAGEEIQDMIEHARIGRRIAPLRAPDRCLVNDDDFIEVFEAFEGVVRARTVFRPEEFPEKRATQNVIHKR